MRHCVNKSLLLLSLVMAPLLTWSQGRFDASLFVGGNFCQVDGDDAGRYNHFGLRAGIGTSFKIGDEAQSPWRMVVEIAYTQKGSELNVNDGQINLQYVEVPLMLAYDALEGDLRLSAGVAPAVKVGAKVTFGGVENVSQSELYRRFDFLPLTVAARYRFASHLSIEARWQMSVVSVYDGSGPYRIIPANHGAFNRLVSFGLAYQL